MPRGEFLPLNLLPEAGPPDRLYDDHDETRMIKKLFVLATNPYVASKVQTVSHRCHHPPPELFIDLPQICHEDLIHSRHPLHDFQEKTLNRLILQAVGNMNNVHTLRIVYGHWAVVESLLWGFFGPLRKRLGKRPVTKLWLESCSLQSMLFENSWHRLDFSKLESLRLRRLRFYEAADNELAGRFWNARGTNTVIRRNHTAGFYSPSVIDVDENIPEKHVEQASHTAEYFTELSMREALSGPPLPASFVRFTHTMIDTPAQFHDDLAEVQDMINVNYAVHSLHGILDMLDCRDVLRNLAPNNNSWTLSMIGFRERRPALIPKGKILEESHPKLIAAAMEKQERLNVDPNVNLNWMNFCLGLVTKNKTATDRLRDFRGYWWKPTLPSLFDTFSSLHAVNLTSLTLDWILFGAIETWGHATLVTNQLAQLHFPKLRAFQFRNTISSYTELDPGIFLFGPPVHHPGLDQVYLKRLGMIDFIERHHSKLLCLAWPMHRFFSPDLSPEDHVRVRDIVAHMGQTLVDLRVDAHLSIQGETMTDDDFSENGRIVCKRRREFIERFAAEMRVLKSIKLEGGIPRDEKREVARALHRCPLEKLVFIGASFPLMNTWGQNGDFLHQVDPGHPDGIMMLEAEDEDSIRAAANMAPRFFNQNHDSLQDFVWQPQYGDFSRAGKDILTYPVLHEIALHHRRTIKELKFCGYSGAPILQGPSAITHPGLHQLRYFDNLEELVMSFWLLTTFDGDSRDLDIIKYWVECRKDFKPEERLIDLNDSDSSDSEPELSTEEILEQLQQQHQAEPMVTDGQGTAPMMPGYGGGDDGVSKFVQDYYNPKMLGTYVAAIMRHHLSRVALNKPGGVRIRASFCLGDEVQDIFDFDIKMEGDGYIANCPREDSWDGGRAAEKMAARRWF